MAADHPPVESEMSAQRIEVGDAGLDVVGPRLTRTPAATLLEAKDLPESIQHLRNGLEIVAAARAATAQHHWRPDTLARRPQPRSRDLDDFFVGHAVILILVSRGALPGRGFA